MTRAVPGTGNHTPPVEAIYAEYELSTKWWPYADIDALWFRDPEAARARVEALKGGGEGAHPHGPRGSRERTAPMHHPPLVLPPGAVTGIGSLPFRDPHTAVQCVAQTCPLLPFWPELPRRSPHARSVEQTFGAFADLVRPERSGSRYEVVPGRLTALLERLEQAPARLEPARSAGFFAFEQAMAAGLFAHAVAVEALARQTLITATCGLGLLPESAVASSFHLAHQLAQRMAQVAQATA